MGKLVPHRIAFTCHIIDYCYRREIRCRVRPRHNMRAVCYFLVLAHAQVCHPSAPADQQCNRYVARYITEAHRYPYEP